MNIFSSVRPEEAASPSPRSQAKLKTRRRVLDAARQLFMERGYDAATIREIAAAAGLSTGAVFASFTDKADLFNQVIAEDFERQMAASREATAPDAPVEEALMRLFEWGYAFHMDQLPLLRTAISLSWSQGLEGDFGDRPSSRMALANLTSILQQGVDRGELPARADVQLTAEMLWDLYMAGYRRILFDDWTVERLAARLRAQVQVILAGTRGLSATPA
jgi:AcrR family transcriptional regulator